MPQLTYSTQRSKFPKLKKEVKPASDVFEIRQDINVDKMSRDRYSREAQCVVPVLRELACEIKGKETFQHVDTKVCCSLRQACKSWNRCPMQASASQSILDTQLHLGPLARDRPGK